MQAKKKGSSESEKQGLMYRKENTNAFKKNERKEVKVVKMDILQIKEQFRDQEKNK